MKFIRLLVKCRASELSDIRDIIKNLPLLFFSPPSAPHPGGTESNGLSATEFTLISTTPPLYAVKGKPPLAARAAPCDRVRARGFFNFGTRRLCRKPEYLKGGEIMLNSIYFKVTVLAKKFVGTRIEITISRELKACLIKLSPERLRVGVFLLDPVSRKWLVLLDESYLFSDFPPSPLSGHVF